MIGRSMSRRRITIRVATRSGGKVGEATGPVLGPGRLMPGSTVGSGGYEGSVTVVGGCSTALVYDSRPLASSATPIAVRRAGRSRRRSRVQTVSTAGTLASAPGAFGRPKVRGRSRPERPPRVVFARVDSG